VTDLPREAHSCYRQSIAAGLIAQQAFRHFVPMLILMGKKSTNLLLFLAVTGAVAGPMAYFHFFDRGKAPSQGTTAESQGGVRQTASYEGATGSGMATNIAGLATPGTPLVPPSNVKIQDASAVFDFQITPEWIVAHWPTVSIGLAQLQLEGYRVPLVTGTAQSDLAGSLTYYFNAEQKLHQITFLGTTGDPRPLIALLTGRFHLTRRLVNDPGLVVYEAVHTDNKPASNLQIRLASAAQPNEFYRRYDVKLSVERPIE